MTCESRPPVGGNSTGMVGVNRASDKLKKMREMFWSGRADLNPDLLRPRQARYQAALRPDMKYVKIIKDFPTELLLHLTNFASNCAKTVPNRFH